jgi:hypothetical protein
MKQQCQSKPFPPPLFETTTISPTTPAESNPFLFSYNDTYEHEMMTTKMKTMMNATRQLQQ